MAEINGNNINLKLGDMENSGIEARFEIILSEEQCLHSVLKLIHDMEFDSIQKLEDFVPQIMSMFQENGIDGEVILHRVH